MVHVCVALTRLHLFYLALQNMEEPAKKVKQTKDMRKKYLTEKVRESGPGRRKDLQKIYNRERALVSTCGTCWFVRLQ